MNPKKTFASDNASGVHPKILKAMVDANRGHTVAYGDDPYTEKAKKKFKEHFGQNIDVYFVFGGTGANVLGIKAVTESYHAVLCAQTSHLYNHECGASEKFIGCKLVPIPTEDGKISVEQIKKYLHGLGDEHEVQPKVVSMTQVTELGTVYTPQEIKHIADFVHKNNMYLHMDGARIANAAAVLGVSLKKITADSGVDILSFGGTKNGMMYGEAVIFFHPALSKNFKYIRKQGMQLTSKMRFIAAQFITLLSNNLWFKNARHSNTMARLLARKIQKIPGVEIMQKVESNAIFAKIPKKIIPRLQKKYFFYVWNPGKSIVRLMTTFDTTKGDIMHFASLIKKW